MASPKASQSDFSSRTETAVVSGDKSRETFKSSVKKNWTKITLLSGGFLLLVWGVVFIPTYWENLWRTNAPRATESTTSEASQTSAKTFRSLPFSVPATREWSEEIRPARGLRLKWYAEPDVSYEIITSHGERVIFYKGDDVDTIHMTTPLAPWFKVRVLDADSALIHFERRLPGDPIGRPAKPAEPQKESLPANATPAAPLEAKPPSEAPESPKPEAELPPKPIPPGTVKARLETVQSAPDLTVEGAYFLP